MKRIFNLSYRGWISKHSVTNANGVAQGCSFSLIAINVYMHVWATFIEHIPHVTSRVFIDDAYLWVHINSVDDLVRALQITEQWGTVVGQKLNHSKSVLWATSANARKLAKLHFPSLPLFLEFDVLGAKIYTSDRENFLFDQKKLYKVVADIANLPVARKTKELLIGCKVLPQISFASHISKIPKRALEKMQSEIAQVFWGSRPHWRSKMLVFALLTKAFRVEPTCSRACSTIIEFWRFIHSHPDRVQQCCDLLRNHALSKHSLLARVQDALALFRFQLSEDGFLVFASSRFHILEIGVNDIKPLLQNLCAQWCYERAADQSRKDLAKPTGFLDLALYKSFQQNYTKPFDQSLDLTAHFESQSVGCTITRDRRAAAGFCESKLCRFCNTETESLRHLLTDCSGSLPHEQPPLHELGPNFQLLGLVDHPVGIAKHRLQFSSIRGDFSPAFLGDADAKHFWTDGSVILAESYWLTSAAYSIIDASGQIVDTGPVQPRSSPHILLNCLQSIKQSSCQMLPLLCTLTAGQLLINSSNSFNFPGVKVIGAIPFGGKPFGQLLNRGSNLILNRFNLFGFQPMLLMIWTMYPLQISSRTLTIQLGVIFSSTVLQTRQQRRLHCYMLQSTRQTSRRYRSKYSEDRFFLHDGIVLLG